MALILSHVKQNATDIEKEEQDISRQSPGLDEVY
jgi:hypothetical protein